MRIWARDMPGVGGLLEPLFKVLEHAHGLELTRDLLSLITCSESGLPEPVCPRITLADIDSFVINASPKLSRAPA